jgi:hypothetical protein
MPAESAERGTRGESCSVMGISRGPVRRLFAADALWMRLMAFS